MKILMTGGLGNIGKHLIDRLSVKNDLVTLSSNSSIKKLPNNSFRIPSLVIQECNVEQSKIKKIIKKYKPDIVIHLAALSGLQRCEKNPDKAFQINVLGTFNVCKSCAESKSHLIFLSSREIYGETKNSKTSEKTSSNPNNVYGLTKSVAENIIQTMAKIYDFNYTILRITNVYGSNMGRSGINNIFWSAIHKKQIKINGGKQLVNLIHIDDLIDAIILVINNNKSNNKIYNVGSNDTLQINELVNLVVSTLPNNVKINYSSRIECENLVFRPDLTKIQADLNYFPKTDLKNGIKKTLHWYKNNAFKIN